MKVSKTDLPGILLITPRVFSDTRGFFAETWHQSRYQEIGLPGNFVQDNLSYSKYGVLRGLHFQYPQAQGKLVYVLQGDVFDVAVDIRVGSPTFGRWIGMVLSGENRCQVYIPEGFAHGFCVTSEYAVVVYKCTEFYNPRTEGGVLWNDPDIGIDWPLHTPILSEKDRSLPPLKSLSPARLSPYSSSLV
jgi:dTDP-4-dehydrorhamnose 3,5-epimerase